MSRDGEAGQTTEDVQRRVEELGWWYHHFELPSGVWTGTGEPPAYDPIERWKLFEPHLPDDLEGKSVLDVGGNSGYFSLRMKQRGAGRCVMVEPVVEFVDQATFRLRTVRRRGRGRVRGRSRLLPDDRRAVRLRPLPRPLLPPEVSGPRPRPAGRDDEGADGLQLAHRGRSSGAACRGGNRAVHARQDAPLRREETGPEPRGPGRARSETWSATSSSQLHSLGCRSSKAPIAATSRTGGSRTTRRSSRSLGARASRSSLARIRRCSSPSRSGTSERPATASSSSRATARPKAARSSRASSMCSPSGSGSTLPTIRSD